MAETSENMLRRFVPICATESDATLDLWLADAVLRMDPQTRSQVLGQQVTERMQPLGEVLLSREWVTQQQLRVALARKLGYPVVNLSTFKPQIEALARLPADLARTLEVLPLVHRAGRLVVAMQDVTRQAVLEQLQTLTHCAIAPALAGTGDLKAAIERGYERIEEKLLALGARITRRPG